MTAMLAETKAGDEPSYGQVLQSRHSTRCCRQILPLQLRAPH